MEKAQEKIRFVAAAPRTEFAPLFDTHAPRHIAAPERITIAAEEGVVVRGIRAGHTPKEGDMLVMVNHVPAIIKRIGNGGTEHILYQAA